MIQFLKIFCDLFWCCGGKRKPGYDFYGKLKPISNQTRCVELIQTTTPNHARERGKDARDKAFGSRAIFGLIKQEFMDVTERKDTLGNASSTGPAELLHHLPSGVDITATAEFPSPVGQ